MMLHHLNKSFVRESDHTARAVCLLVHRVVCVFAICHVQFGLKTQVLF